LQNRQLNSNNINSIIGNIKGLEWQPTYHERTEKDHSIIFPTTHLVHIVYHGEKPFSHGIFGIHLGFADRLTFLGPSSRILQGYFIDCRKDSPTLHHRASLTFTPSLNRTLIVPNGVAHTFDNMEGIDTINSFDALLPDPSVLLTEKSPWAKGTDIQYFPLNVNDEDIPVVQESTYPASETFYDLLSEMQKATLRSVSHEYPHVEDVVFPDGSSARILIRKPIAEHQKTKDFEPISEIEGVVWKSHFIVWSGTYAGYSALTDRSPIKVTDEGALSKLKKRYSVSRSLENRLTFVGLSTALCKLLLKDCRIDSPTYNKEHISEFYPSPLRFLCIPPGVAYSIDCPENIFSINRPLKCDVDVEKDEFKDDTIVWPIEKQSIPTFNIKNTDIPVEYYKKWAAYQRNVLMTDR